MGRIFGTDGARGIANIELTCELAMQIGRASAVVLTKHIKDTSRKPKIIIARDTRISSQMLESALSAGLCSVGADVELLGVIPTPAVAYLVSKYEADAGIMISASHNPFEFNGIKLFSNTGYKLSDDIEEEIESIILDNPDNIEFKYGDELGKIYRRRSAPIDYVNHLISSIDIDLTGLNVAIDCANGSASTTAEFLFTSLGAKVNIINAAPNGSNINENCGSTHINTIAKFVKENKCDLGFAFDGDADRCLAVDENGVQVNGDQIIAIFAKYMKAENKLNKDTAVVTVMSNFGMQKFGKENNINIVQTSVGDRYVLEEMLKNGYNLGGEDSGHIIIKDYAQTGDGQLTAVQLMRICKKSGLKMSQLADIMQKSPQVLKSVKATTVQKEKYKTDNDLLKKINEFTVMLGENGRILVRPSGTEPVIRVMVEGNDFDIITKYCNDICDIIAERIS